LDTNAYRKNISEFPSLAELNNQYLYMSKAICPDAPSIKRQLKKMYRQKKYEELKTKEIKPWLDLTPSLSKLEQKYGSMKF
jgi:hypothetical protein